MIWLLSIFVKSASFTIGIMPRSIQMNMGRALGLFWFYIVRFRRNLAIEHIKKAFPHWPEEKVLKTARRNFENYGCGFIELLTLPILTKDRASKLLHIEGRENIDEALKQGKGLFFLSLHIGSWELMSASSEFFEIPLNVITKKIKNKSINRIWVKMREGRGIKLISEEKSTFEILRAVRRNEAVGFILDQFLGPPVGTRVKFFGHETGAPAALALFADRTRSPVLPTYNIREPDGRIRIVVEKPIPFMEQGSNDKNISFMTQVYTSKIEEIVKTYPEQWLWIHRRWKPFRE